MKQNKRVIGLTGTIASGKSTAAAYFSEHCGIPTIDADRVGHRILQEETVRRQLIDAFGADILSADGEVDRKRLGALVFADAAKRSRLNAITHPAICAYIRDWIRQAQQEHDEAPFVLVEAIELLRSELKDMVDEVWVVYADPAVRARRMMETRGLTRQEADARLQSQWDDAAYRQQAQRVFDGNGTRQALWEQCEQAYELIRKEAR